MQARNDSLDRQQLSLTLRTTASLLAAGLVLAGGLVLACGPEEPPEEESGVTASEAESAPEEAAPDSPAVPLVELSTIQEGTDLFGKPLYRPLLADDFRLAQEALLKQAEQRLAEAPSEVDSWVWVGRRQAYLGRYGEAIETYSRALDELGKHPELYRHRGHRYLTTRRFEPALSDFRSAAGLTEGVVDTVEEDGLPNAANIPTSTLGTNIWYHLGLSHYLRGEYELAEKAYRRCLTLSKNPDMEIATQYWLYLSLMAQGKEDTAQELAAAVDGQIELLENYAYQRLLLLFRGDLSDQALLEEARQGGAASLATHGYGIGRHLAYSGDDEAASQVWKEALEAGSWASFGYIAAEAELNRRGSSHSGEVEAR